MFPLGRALSFGGGMLQNMFSGEVLSIVGDFRPSSMLHAHKESQTFSNNLTHNNFGSILLPVAVDHDGI